MCTIVLYWYLGTYLEEEEEEEEEGEEEEEKGVLIPFSNICRPRYQLVSLSHFSKTQKWADGRKVGERERERQRPPGQKMLKK